MRISDWSSDVCSSDLSSFFRVGGSDSQLHDGIGREATALVLTRLEVAADLLAEVVEVPGVAVRVEALFDNRRGQQRDHAAVDHEDLAVDGIGMRGGEGLGREHG